MNNELETGNKLLLLHGISQIENGLQMIEWMDDHSNQNSLDALSILRNRFTWYKAESLADGKRDYLAVDITQEALDNVQHGAEIKIEITKRLKALRIEVRKATSA